MVASTKPHKVEHQPGRLSRELHGAWNYVSARWTANHLRQEQHAAEEALVPIEQNIGEHVETATVAAQLPAMQVVRDARTVLSAAEAEVQKEKASVAAAEDRVAFAAGASWKALQAMREETERRLTAMRAARAELSKADEGLDLLNSRIRQLQGTLHTQVGIPAAIPAPPAEAGEQTSAEIDRLVAARDPAEAEIKAAKEKHAAAHDAYNAKLNELERAEEEWNAAEAEMIATVKAAEARLEAANQLVGERRAALNEAHRELGRAVCEAGIGGNTVAEIIKQADPLLKQAYQAATSAAAMNERAVYNQRQAMHVAIALMATIVLIAAALIVLVARHH
jgi:chromosome segregation ATPase